MAYWEDETPVPFDVLVEAVEAYFSDDELIQGKPNINWAPLSDEIWELVGFAPDYQMAVLDSVYATPEDAKHICAMYPEVGIMELE